MTYIKVFAIFVVAVAASHAFVISQTEEDGTATRDNILDQKFAFLENFIKQYNVDVAAIKASTEKHSVVKRAIPVKAEDGIAIRDQTEEKYAFLQNLLQQFNVYVEAIKASRERLAIAKLAVREDTAVPSTPESGDTRISRGIFDGIFGFINDVLKSFVDGFVEGFISTSNGILSDSILDLQAFLHDLIDRLFPTTSGTNTS